MQAKFKGFLTGSQPGYPSGPAGLIDVWLVIIHSKW